MQKLLPPILWLFLALVALMLPLLPLPQTMLMLPASLAWVVGAGCFGLGMLLCIVGRLQFRRNNCEINTFKQPRNLVTNGLFSHTRNPMYLGFLISLIGVVLFVNVWPALLAPLGFFLFAQFLYIPHEERAAANAFGEDYVLYRQTVRRWI